MPLWNMYIPRKLCGAVIELAVAWLERKQRWGGDSFDLSFARVMRQDEAWETFGSLPTPGCTVSEKFTLLPNRYVQEVRLILLCLVLLLIILRPELQSPLNISLWSLKKPLPLPWKEIFQKVLHRCSLPLNLESYF